MRYSATHSLFEKVNNQKAYLYDCNNHVVLTKQGIFYCAMGFGFTQKLLNGESKFFYAEALYQVQENE